MTLPNLDDLRVFVRVVDAKSFSAAARQLHLAPKTVSKQIARLEQVLGCHLFERNTRNLKITAEGRAITERARQAVTLISDLGEQLNSDNSRELRGRICITAPAPFGRKYLAPAIDDFWRQHPQLQFELRLSDQIIDLFSSDLDLAIRIGDLADSGLLARRIADSRRILVASASYLQQYGYPKQPLDLQQHRCLVFAYPGLQHNHWHLSRQGIHEVLKVKGSACSDNGEVLREWCIAGLGISMRETWDVLQELHCGQLVQVLPEWQLPLSTISLVRVPRDPLPQRLDQFIEFLCQRWAKAAWS